ncbi:MAG: 1,4-alpha-glucan branching enzyme, partial [Ghiorsea sp.]
MTALPSIAYEVQEARSHDPFAYLGRHQGEKSGMVVRAIKPRAEKVSYVNAAGKATAMPRIEGTDIFELHLKKATFKQKYHFEITDK